MQQLDEIMKLCEQAEQIFNATLITIKQKQDQQQEIKCSTQLTQQEEIKISAYEDSHNDCPHSTAASETQLSLLEQIPDLKFSDNLQHKIINLKMNSVSSRRKDQLFKRYRREQEQCIVQRRKQLEEKYSFRENQKDQGEFSIKRGQRQEKFTLKVEDFDKLKPETDLNDTILDNYLKILQLAILPPDIEEKTFIFSSFFMGKLLGEALQGDFTPQKQTEAFITKCKNKIKQTYSTIKRWTRKIDLFSKEILVIPINSFKHWNCLIVLSPNTVCNETSMCKVLYFDSMFQKRNMFPQAIKTYLELELAERKGISQDLSSIPTYQLLVPRQTNTHDCGLYTLCYIEFFLSNRELLEADLSVAANKHLLMLFPRSIIFTMRECLRSLYYNLLKKENKEQVIKKYIQMREQIIRQSIKEIDYDEINEREFKKYFRINVQAQNEEDDKVKQSEVEYGCKVKFYLDSDVNHYEKDR